MENISKSINIFTWLEKKEFISFLFESETLTYRLGSFAAICRICDDYLSKIKAPNVIIKIEEKYFE
jgi:hypothetical protein